MGRLRPPWRWPLLRCGRIRKRLVEEGLEHALREQPRPGQRRKLSGKQEAHVIAVACSTPPEGRGRWTLRLLSRESSGVGLRPVHLAGDGAPDAQKNELKPWQREEWCIPAVSAEFVAAMEDVLDLYEEPYDPQRPPVCFDETSTQLIGESRIPLPARPGRRERFDYEYRRNGTRNLFMLCEPLRGWRHVAVTERRRMGDFAHQMRWLADEAYTKAEKIRVVLDNLNTHRPASLYETFDPAEARRILKRLEFHYTPKHGSWLNMAEIELSVFSRQCLNRRIPDGATLTRELAALVRRRNEAHAHYRLAIYHLGCTDHFASSLSYPAKSSGLSTSILAFSSEPRNDRLTRNRPLGGGAHQPGVFGQSAGGVRRRPGLPGAAPRFHLVVG